MNNYHWLLITTVLMWLTWAVSASTIGTECEKLGSFYIGDKIYKCEVVK